MNRAWALQIARPFCCVAGFLLLNAFVSQTFLNAATRWDLDLMRTLAHRKLEAPPRVLLLGDSHVAFGISHELAPATVNMAGLGEGYQVTYYKLRHILAKNGKTIRLVCMEAGPQCFSGKRFADNEEFPYGLAIDYIDSYVRHGHPVRTLREAIANTVFNYHDLPLRADAKLAFTAVAANPPSFHDERTRREKAPALIVKHFSTRPEWWNEDMAFYFEQVLLLCRENRIPIALVQMPMSKEYYEELGRAIPVAEFDAKLGETLAKCPEVKIFDYRTLYLNEPEMFMDLDHLNGIGVPRITKRLQEDLAAHGLLP